MIRNREKTENILRGRLIGIYGFRKGLECANVVLPSIFADFEKTAGTGLAEETEELYRLEDGKAEILLKGRREAGKRHINITEVFFNGEKLEFL